MANYVAIFSLSLLGAVTLHASSNADLISEYRQRSGIVTKLVDLYEKYDEGRDGPSNQTLRESFISYFDDNFDGTTEWMTNAFTFEPPIPVIMRAIVQETKTDYNKVKEFGDGARETLESAYDMTTRYVELNGTNSDKIDVDQDRTGVATLKETVTKTLAYIKTTAWKSQFKIDINYLVYKLGINKALSQNIFRFLSNKYFYRAWFTAVYRTSTPAKLCANSSATSHSLTFNGYFIRVFQADPSRPNQKQFAKAVLNNIPDARRSYWTCKNRIDEIVEESAYKCDSNILSMFSVFAGETPTLGYHTDSMVFKFVVRRRWFGKCNPSTYPVIIFV